MALDFAAEILALAKQRYEDLPRCDRFGTPITFVEGDALDLPFQVTMFVEGGALDLPFTTPGPQLFAAPGHPSQDSSFDAATMGYGLRNVSSIPVALSEIHRVLKPGAKASILDFNNPRCALVDMTAPGALLR